MKALWYARSADPTDVSSISPVHLWPTLVGGGIAQLVFGMLGLLLAGVATLVSVLVFGVLLAVGGIVELVAAFRFRGHRRGLFVYLLAGIISVAAGVLLLSNPIAGAMTLTLFIGFLLVVLGALRLVATASQDLPARGWAIAHGLVTLLLGVLFVVDWPASSVWSIGTIVSANLIVTGFAHLLLGFELRNLATGAAGRPATGAATGPSGFGPAGAV